jgi:hypothetical protein
MLSPFAQHEHIGRSPEGMTPCPRDFRVGIGGFCGRQSSGFAQGLPAARHAPLQHTWSSRQSGRDAQSPCAQTGTMQLPPTMGAATFATVRVQSESWQHWWHAPSAGQHSVFRGSAAQSRLSQHPRQWAAFSIETLVQQT